MIATTWIPLQTASSESVLLVIVVVVVVIVVVVSDIFYFRKFLPSLKLILGFCLSLHDVQRSPQKLTIPVGQPSPGVRVSPSIIDRTL